MVLIELAKKSKDIIKPFGSTEVLLYYGIVAEKLKNYLKDKEIATKIWLPNANMPFFLKRGSKSEPLYIDEFKVDEKLLETRKRIEKLSDAKNELTKTQIKIWDYFVPRKLIDFFYAANKEGKGKDIERIFFDIDRGNISSEGARNATKELVDAINSDDKFWDLVKGDLFVLWTGSSFHIIIFLNKNVNNGFYERYISYSKDEPLASFTGRWAKKINGKFKFTITGGHEKIKNGINIDPSQTPSGKLARSPFSLHMKDARTIDGVALPLNDDMLKSKSLINELKKYSPRKVVDELKELAKRFPKQVR